MAFVPAILAGLIGTLVFTLLLYVGPMMGMPKMDIIGIVGTMVSEPGGTARVIGTVGHFMMGAIFAIIYAFLWSAGIGAVTWWWGAIFGVVHGAIIAFVGMPVMMSMHPRAPERQEGPKALVGTLMGHAVFGLVVAVSYAGLA